MSSRRNVRQALPVQPSLKRWLRAPGSLSLRLRATGQRFEVRPLQQSTDRVLPGEAVSVGARRLHAREVLLLVDDEPLVYARSVTASRNVTGAWRSLRALGSRSLAELLFSQRWVSRSPLFALRLSPGSAWLRHLQAQCADQAPELAHSRVVWARYSVFYKAGQPLRVLEAFAPGIKERNAQAINARKTGKPSMVAISSSSTTTGPTPAGVPE
jgi:chorismate--pyruvate lyase